MLLKLRRAFEMKLNVVRLTVTPCGGSMPLSHGANGCPPLAVMVLLLETSVTESVSVEHCTRPERLHAISAEPQENEYSML